MALACITLCYIVLYCIVLYCIVLYCIVLYCIHAFLGKAIALARAGTHLPITWNMFNSLSFVCFITKALETNKVTKKNKKLLCVFILMFFTSLVHHTGSW